MKQLAKQEGVTEELKRLSQMAWIGAINNIRDRVNEIIALNRYDTRQSNGRLRVNIIFQSVTIVVHKGSSCLQREAITFVIKQNKW